MSDEDAPYEPRYTHYFVVAATRDEDGKIVLLSDEDTAMARFDDRPVWDDVEVDWLSVDDDERKADDDAFTERLAHLLSAQDKYAAYNEAVVAAALSRTKGFLVDEAKHLWDAITIANTVFGDTDLPEVK